MSKDEFGGVEVDEFGGVAVDDETSLPTAPAFESPTAITESGPVYGSQPPYAVQAPELSPELQAKKSYLQDQMSQTRSEGRFSDMELAAINLAERAAYTASQLDPVSAVNKAIHAFDPNPQPPISTEQAQRAIRFLNPFETPSAGSAGQGAEQFAAEFISGMSEPEVAAAVLAGKIDPKLAARLFQPGLIKGSGEAVNRLVEAKTPAEGVKAGLETLLTIGGALGIERGLQREATAPKVEAPVESESVKGGPESGLSPEAQARSRANNSLRGMAEASGVEFVEGDTPQTIMAKINAKAAKSAEPTAPAAEPVAATPQAIASELGITHRSTDTTYKVPRDQYVDANGVTISVPAGSPIEVVRQKWEERKAQYTPEDLTRKVGETADQTTTADESQGPNQPFPELTPEQAAKQRSQSRRLVEERYRFASPEVLKQKLSEFDALNPEPTTPVAQTPTPAAEPVVAAAKVEQQVQKVAATGEGDTGIAASIRKKLASGEPLKGDTAGGRDFTKTITDFGQSLYTKGMKFADWSARMVKELGENVRNWLKTAWDHVLLKDIGRIESLNDASWLDWYKRMKIGPGVIEELGSRFGIADLQDLLNAHRRGMADVAKLSERAMALFNSGNTAEGNRLMTQAQQAAKRAQTFHELARGIPEVKEATKGMESTKDIRAKMESMAAEQTAKLVGQAVEQEPAFSGISLQGVTDAVKSVGRFVKDLRNEELKAPERTDRRRAILNWSAKLQRSFGEAAAKQLDIDRRVPNAIRQEGITNWIQAEGDPAVLASRRADTATWRDPNTGKPHPDAKRLLAGYDAALRLTPEEIAVANEVKTDYANFGARGQAADVLHTFKDNYVTQIWNRSKGPGGSGAGRTLKENFRFSKASTFPTFFDGEQAGYSPKTKAIGKLLPMYSHEMNSVIAARELVAEMGQGTASDGRPLLAPKGVGIPVGGQNTGQSTLVMPKVAGESFSDYKVLANQPALSGWKWVSKDSAGNPIFLKADLALHPEAFKHLRAVLGRSAIREWYGERTTALAEIPKALVHALDMANSETKRTMLGLLASFHQVQTGTHAVGHRINPFFNIPKIDLVNNRAQMDAAKHGLMMLPDKASESQFMEGFRTAGLISKIPGIGPIADWYSNYLFSEYIPGLKFKTYAAILDRNTRVYDRQLRAGTVTEGDIKLLSAEQANAAYGHLNYADLGRNPTIQHIAQIGLLAPDFLEARGRFAGQAIKGVTGAKVGREQLLALGTLAIAQAALAYTSAKITGGEWDKKRPFEFTLGNRRYTMRSVPEDLVNLVTKTRQFVHSRLSPIVGKGALQYVTGVDYRGRKVSAAQTTKELVAQPIPLTVRGFTGFGSDTLSGLEQLAGSLGLRISRYSPMMDMHDLIVDFKKKSDDPKLQADIELQEKEVFASPYEKLRAVLHSGNLAAARKEYDAVAKVRTQKQIDAAMKPWTGGTLNPQTFTISPRNPKPFTGSFKTERDFVKSLTPEQLVTYRKAQAERVQFYQAFKNMLRTTATE